MMMMTIHVAAKLISLLTVIDDKEQRTDNISNNPLPAKFQRSLLQLTIFAGLHFYHAPHHGIHHFVKITRRSAFSFFRSAVCKLIHSARTSTVQIGDVTQDTLCTAVSADLFHEQRSRQQHRTYFDVTFAYNGGPIKAKNDWN